MGDAAMKKMSADKAIATLEHPDGEMTVDTVMAAFRRAMLLAHPDTAPTGEATPERVTNLLLAKKTLLDDIAGRKTPCAQCRGRGRVPHGIGTAVCGACKGTGDRT